MWCGVPEVQGVIYGALFLRFWASYVASSAQSSSRENPVLRTGPGPRHHLSLALGVFSHARLVAG